MRRSSLYLIGFPEEDATGNGKEEVLNDIMGETFHNRSPLGLPPSFVDANAAV